MNKLIHNMYETVRKSYDISAFSPMGISIILLGEY